MTWNPASLRCSFALFTLLALTPWSTARAQAQLAEAHLAPAHAAPSATTNSLVPNPTRWREWVRHLESEACTVGVAIINFQNGELLFEHNADRAFKPASTAKLFTTAAAFEYLEPSAPLATEFRASAKIEGGVLDGDLWAIGWGDPGYQTTFLTSGLEVRAEEIARALKAAGLQRVNGRLIFDGRAFDSERTHPEWPQKDLAYEWAAPITALSIGGACVEFSFDIGRHVTLAPLGLVAEVEDRTTKNDKRPAWHAVWIEAKQTWELRGTVPARGEIAPIRAVDPHPERSFARWLHGALQRHGIVIAGGIESATTAIPESPPLCSIGTPLAEVVYHANKESLNQTASCLWKHLGARYAQAGSWEGGAQAVREVLARWKLSEPALAAFHIVDGSGLSHANRASARLMVETLHAASTRPWWGAFAVSLPRAGVDGTLEGRMREAVFRDRVRAKTGWIAGASSLAGTVQTRAGQEWGFAVLIEYDGKRQGLNRSLLKPELDALVKMLIESDFGGEK